MATSYEYGGDPRAAAEQMLQHNKELLHFAVSVINPNNPNADPLSVLPAAGEVRAEDAGLDLSDSQVTKLRSIAAELGYGRETDLTLTEQGLYGAHVIIEGGMAHKVMAEALMVLEDATATPTSLIFSASPHRNIEIPAEIVSTERILGETKATEYDMVRDLIEMLPGFEADIEIPLDASYDVLDNFAVGRSSSNQFVVMGTIGKTPVVLMRVDKVRIPGTIQYKQPGAADIMRIVSDVSTQQGDKVWPVAMATSATYQPSRSVDAAIVGLETGRRVGLATYGTDRLAKVKGEVAPEPAPANQLPGELHKMALETEKLDLVLRKKR